ncbi:MAG: hypothetical protein HZB98_04610 [Bacteroidia bacterium]|nr:hypothetical protein [Bacteroidia bacterium]
MEKLMSENENKYKVWFFAGAETRDNRFNKFTGSFISIMNEIFGEDFDYIKGVFYNSNLSNVIWALNNAQKPISDPASSKFTSGSFRQMVSNGYDRDARLVIISSSSGSIVAAQLACYLSEQNKIREYFSNPFHLVLGASMVSPESQLFRKLLKYQDEGIIGTILHDEIQDEDDNAFGVGGKTRFEAYRNALGITFPFLSGRYKSPSFLNTHPENGHIHRKRSMTVKKALDYIDIILVKHKLAGNHYSVKAQNLLEEKIKGNSPT